ncbi:hypothetical protein GCM10010372_30390 [Streptomyces tauricus]|nr:hypothetical protein GCM10010372_30390 [Streptomyces tauricus]
MATSIDTDQTAVLALLELPAPETLSEPQMCGRACVWCGDALSNDTAVDLGVRTAEVHGITADWFPRTDKRCVGGKAYAQLFVHAVSCEPCRETAAGCDTAVALRRLMREGRR